MKDKKILSILNYFDIDIKNEILKIPDEYFNDIIEFRIRLNLYIEIITKNFGFYYMKSKKIDEKLISEFLEKICDYSLYSYEKDIEKGFLTIKGGHRLGIVGKFIDKDGGKFSIRNISYINIRVNKEVIESSREIFDKLLKNKNANLLILGAPLSGKTTILRDLCRLISDEKKMKVSLIDERDEIANSMLGNVQNYVGKRTDVFSSYSKTIGVVTAIRSMSPEFIILDELSIKEDFDAVKKCCYCGCNIVATSHFDISKEKKLNDELIFKYTQYDIFDYIVFLDNSKNIGNILKIVKVR